MSLTQEQISQLVQATVSGMKDTIVNIAVDAAKEAADKAIDSQKAKFDDIKAKMKEDRKSNLLTFKKKGNKRMYEHEKEVLEIIDESVECIENKNIEKAKEILEKGKTIVSKRMKVIRLADREDWLTVNEYLSDELASDENDDKHITKAIKSAAAKRDKRVKSYKALSNKHVRTPYNRYSETQSSYSRGQSFYNNNETPYARRAITGPCFTCGRLGHYSKDCMSNRRNDTNN